ncbi:hypothetical protein ACJJTC_007541 [Scirpophaga incertulas]
MTWVSPFVKQCLVTFGVALNMMQMGLVMGIATTMVPQLRESVSSMRVDDNSGSWIAALPAFTFLIGNLSMPTVMGKFGRKIANLTCITITFMSWIGVIFASSITILLIARCFQGIGIGMTSILGSVSVGEYTSPKNRGPFLMALSVAISFGVFLVHTLGLYLHWKNVAVICGVTSMLDLVIMAFAPESPAWLADQGKYDECSKTFRWLRGDKEEEELKKMIDGSILTTKNLKSDGESKGQKAKLAENITYYISMMKKKEVYKPIIIMIHVYTMAQWSGVNLFASYAVDVTRLVAGADTDITVIVTTFDVQRMISNAVALVIIKHVKRKTMLLMTVCLNVLAMFALALYAVTKMYDMLPVGNIYIGLTLAHIHMFSVAIGALPIAVILAGEIFPLKYKGIAGAISSIGLSVNMFSNVKTVPFLFNSIGLHGTYLLYCGVLIYCLVVVSLLLPETKDKTLQEIEDNFRRSKTVQRQDTEKCGIE